VFRPEISAKGAFTLQETGQRNIGLKRFKESEKWKQKANLKLKAKTCLPKSRS
jgi:hypothetical protein